jgi:hypothetical protein
LGLFTGLQARAYPACLQSLKQSPNNEHNHRFSAHDEFRTQWEMPLATSSYCTSTKADKLQPDWIAILNK